MKKISKGKVLIIPDVHQCIGGFVKPILEKETDWDHIVFLGDWFDCFETPDGAIYYGITQTCLYINELFDDLGDKVTWLAGNHDIAYFATYVEGNYNITPNRKYYCSGWSKNKASTFNKNINPKWVQNVELCCQVGEYTLSHAGFHYSQFKPHMSEQNNVEALYESWERDKAGFMLDNSHWIWDVGICRGGMSDSGSPVWLDWNHEFVPVDNLNQIVGHTNSHHLKKPKSNNYCIDTYRLTYAVWESGKLEIKYAHS